MSKSVSDFLNIEAEAFEASGAFDAVLDVDARFYIDPHLLASSTAEEFAGAYEKVKKHFGDILRLLSHSKVRGDSMWRQAERLFSFSEFGGLCIGYSSGGTSGSGLGATFRERILQTAKEVTDAGIVDPAIFELVGILEEGIGCDRISDMVANIIAENILHYSQRVFAGFGATMSEFRYKSTVYQVPTNPYSGSWLLLVPRDVLRPLPIARSFDDIETVCEHNRLLRQRVNELIGLAFRGRRQRPSPGAKKRVLRRALMSDPDMLREVIEIYKEGPAVPYDFTKDPVGEANWHREARKLAAANPLQVSLPAEPLTEELLKVVLKICGKFKSIVEDNGVLHLLYEARNKPKHEAAAQKLFYAVADCYCEANGLDLSPETNSGRGPVDFKFSKGYADRILVEVKLTTNTRLLHGLQTQLAEYQKAERAVHAIFLVIDVAGGSPTRLQEVQDVIRLAQANGQQLPHVVFVDARPKVSASRYLAAE
jgi:hypothetical protein